MRLYADSSALVKLVQAEAESAALRRYLRRHRDDDCVSSALARVELNTARELGSDLRSVVTYDQRMAAAAEGTGLVVVGPTG